MPAMGGGCLCRRIRYVADIDDCDAYLCHCNYCRRATGGVAGLFKSMPRTAVRWEREPDWYRSSPIAERPFCARCGTPLGFRFIGDAVMDLTIGSFDEPGFFRPTENGSIETKLDAWEDTSHLPGTRIDGNAKIRQLWIDATGQVPE